MMPPLPTTTRCRRGGVTLVEVVIAIFILTVGVLSIISLFPSGYKLTKNAIGRSVAALAARDALARILAESNKSSFDFPTTTEGICSIADRDRVGTIFRVDNATQITCRLRGDESPGWTSNALSGYYLVITSGTTTGSLFTITGNGGDTITCANANPPDGFRSGTGRAGVPLRVGDYFAVIGAKTGEKCFPTSSTTSEVNGVSISHTSFLGSGANRTIPVACEGDPSKSRWDYSYGCIFSAPSAEMRNVYRVDVFVYRGFNDSGAVAVDGQSRPAGHFVTYIGGLADYANVSP